MPSSPSVIRQAGVIAVSDGRICVLSSRSGKRWVVPKGCLEPGKTAAEIALQERLQFERLISGPANTP